MHKLLLALLVFFTSAQPAFADTYVIQVRGLSPKTPAKMATCNENNRPCFITLQIGEEGKALRYIDIAATFDGEEAQVQFMENRTIMPIGNDGRTVLNLPLETSETVTLLSPRTVDTGVLVRPLVMRQGQVVAKLDVLAFRQKSAKD